MSIVHRGVPVPSSGVRVKAYPAQAELGRGTPVGVARDSSGSWAGFARRSVATDWRLGVAAVAARQFQQYGQAGDLVRGQVAQQLFGKVLNRWIGFSQESEARGGDLCPDHAAVALVALLADELEHLQPGEQAGNIGLGRDHAIADGRAGESLRLGAAQDAQHVILRGRDAPRADLALEGALQAVGRAQQV
jgi:hypothetical protein